MQDQQNVIERGSIHVVVERANARNRCQVLRADVRTHRYIEAWSTLTVKFNGSHPAWSTSGVVTVNVLTMLRVSWSFIGNGVGEAEAEAMAIAGRKIKFDEQSVDLSSQGEEGRRERERLTRAMRDTRRKGIREKNFLKAM